MKRPLALLATALLLLPPPAAAYTPRPKPQPPNGKYTISAELPEGDAFLIVLSTLREGEDLEQFWQRTEEEFHALQRQDDARCFVEEEVESETGGPTVTSRHRREDAPDVRYRGHMLRNPAAAEPLRDILVPLNRRGEYWNGPIERYLDCEQFLCVEFTRRGITARPARRVVERGEQVEDGPLHSWTWEQVDAFLAALPQLLCGKKSAEPVTHDWGIGGMWREQQETGRRMLLVYGETGWPLTHYWETLASAVKLTGEEWVTYFFSPMVQKILSQEQAAARAYIRREQSFLPWERPIQPLRLPQPEVPQPEIELPIESPAAE